MVVIALAETRFQEWLERELQRRGSTKAKLAAGIERKPQTVYAWFNEGRTPSPELCILIAQYLHVPVTEVLKQAGHLPSDWQEEPAEPMPEWANLLPMLSRADAEYVGRLVESMAQRPVQPDEGPAQEGPR